MRESDDESVEPAGIDDPSNPAGVVSNPEEIDQPMGRSDDVSCPIGRTNGQAKYRRNRGRPGAD